MQNYLQIERIKIRDQKTGMAQVYTIMHAKTQIVCHNEGLLPPFIWRTSFLKNFAFMSGTEV